jgi:hypothetical protein
MSAPIVATVVAPAPGGYKPGAVLDVPMTGLNPLIGLGAFQVQQQVEMLEAALNVINIDYEGANKYKVKDPEGRDMLVSALTTEITEPYARARTVRARANRTRNRTRNRYSKPSGREAERETERRYFVAEESGCCMRQLCSPNHTMKLHMTDMAGRKVLTMDRPWTFNCCCCEWGNLCGKTHMDVYMGEQDEQKMIGSVRMPCFGGGFSPKFDIHDVDGDVQASVTGPCCFISDLCGAKFGVKDKVGNDIGTVNKLGVKSMGDFAKEAMTDADNFEITFPVETRVETKALMIGTLLLLDYTFFEGEGAFEIDPCGRGCKFKLCDIFCCGCIVPCTCNCQPDNSGAPPKPDGGPPTPDVAPVAAAATMLRDE